MDTKLAAELLAINCIYAHANRDLTASNLGEVVQVGQSPGKSGGTVMPGIVDAADIVNFVRSEVPQGAVCIERLRDNIMVLFGAGGNIAVLAGADGKVMVDSGILPSQAKIKDGLQSISMEPVRYLINTH